MTPCACETPHERRRIVLTGGSGAGKTAVLELVRLYEVALWADMLRVQGDEPFSTTRPS